MFLSLSMFCGFVTGAIFTQTGAIPSPQRPLQQQSPWHTKVYYSWSLIRTFFKSFSSAAHTHDRLSPAALFQFLRPTTRTRRGCDIALLPVIAASNAPNAALPSITQRISFHFCCCTHAISSRVPCTMKKMHGPYNIWRLAISTKHVLPVRRSYGRGSIYWVSGCS